MRSSVVAAVHALALISSACSEPPAQPPAPAAIPSPPAVRQPLSDLAPTFIAAPEDGDSVADVVRESMTTCASDKCELVVYVGASWCEPCTEFHRAVDAGRLDRELAGIRFLEFDADSDRARLEDAGYQSRLIPLFAVPRKDGRASQLRTEGGIKGAGAVEHIMKRLDPLLAGVASSAE